jgi:hypothetical protein
MQHIEVMNADGDSVTLEVSNKVADVYERAWNQLMENGYPKSNRMTIDIGKGRILVFEETMGGGFYRLQVEDEDEDDAFEDEEEAEDENENDEDEAPEEK